MKRRLISYGLKDSAIFPMLYIICVVESRMVVLGYKEEIRILNVNTIKILGRELLDCPGLETLDYTTHSLYNK